MTLCSCICSVSSSTPPAVSTSADDISTAVHTSQWKLEGKQLLSPCCCCLCFIYAGRFSNRATLSPSHTAAVDRALAPATACRSGIGVWPAAPEAAGHVTNAHTSQMRAFRQFSSFRVNITVITFEHQHPRQIRRFCGYTLAATATMASVPIGGQPGQLPHSTATAASDSSAQSYSGAVSSSSTQPPQQQQVKLPPYDRHRAQKDVDYVFGKLEWMEREKIWPNGG